MTALRSALYLICFYLWTLPVSVVYLPLLLLPRKAMIPCARLWSRGVLAMMRVIVGVRWRVEGLEICRPSRLFWRPSINRPLKPLPCRC